MGRLADRRPWLRFDAVVVVVVVGFVGSPSACCEIDCCYLKSVNVDVR